MVTKVLMPKLSVTMTEGLIAHWLKKEGDLVNKGEPIVAIETEKVATDIEAPESGILRKVLAEEGAVVAVSETIAIITASGEELTEVEAVPSPPLLETKAEAVGEVAERVEEAGERIVASPAAKRLAREQGVDLSKVRGTGPGGRVVEEDVKRFIEGAKAGPRVKEVIPLAGIRKVTAERLSLSARTAVHCTITMEVDMSNAKGFREQARVSYVDILVKAVAKALEEQPVMNSTLVGDEIKILEDINVGLAVATEKGLIVPVVHYANKRSLSEVASTIRMLVERAREGKLTVDDVTNGTFTVTNLGMFGVEAFTPVINPPEVAILGVGRIAEKPIVIGKEVEARPMMMLSLTFDHRVVDGAPSARFLSRVKSLLEDPKALL